VIRTKGVDVDVENAHESPNLEHSRAHTLTWLAARSVIASSRIVPSFAKCPELTQDLLHVARAMSDISVH
jgi:hypothetical protein